MRRVIIVVTGFCIMAGAAFGIYSVYKYNKYKKESAPKPVEISELAQKLAAEMLASPDAISSLPAELNLEVPFYTQAPFENWDFPWQEACEEASILLVANEYLDKGWTREEFNSEILKLVDWQKKVFGYYTDTTAQEITQILKENFGLTGVIHNNPSYDDVRKILAQGHLIIMTFDGKALGNPYFRNGGPIYHAMVIKGYKEGEKLITNDVGTKHGADYVYEWKVLQNALHDWTKPIQKGPKRMIEVLPPENE